MYAVMIDENGNEIGAVMTNQSMSFDEVLGMIDTSALDYEVTEECASVEMVSDKEYSNRPKG